MKLPRLVIRPVNNRTTCLPDNCNGETVLLFKVRDRRVIAQQILEVYPTSILSVADFTHYAVLPRWLR